MRPAPQAGTGIKNPVDILPVQIPLHPFDLPGYKVNVLKGFACNLRRILCRLLCHFYSFLIHINYYTLILKG